MATLEQIQARMKKLQAQAETLLAKQAQAAVDQIRSIMLKHGLTTADIEARAKARREARSAAATPVVKALSRVAGANGKMPPKYRDPKTGATWSGHARPPAWIKDVKDRTKFLIDGAKQALGTAKARSRTATSTTSTEKRKGKQPPKYENPKTGATWSGRGPAPAWLASVKDRSKFLIGAASSVGGTTSKKAASSKKSAMDKKSAAGKKASSKTASAKAASKKVAAGSKRTASKKSAAKKTTVARKSVKRGVRSRASANGASNTQSPVALGAPESTT
jgi:DNA-binding protein H-NS